MVAVADKKILGAFCQSRGSGATDVLGVDWKRAKDKNKMGMNHLVICVPAEFSNKWVSRITPKSQVKSVVFI